jgi:phosphinothricin acetyltransferase
VSQYIDIRPACIADLEAINEIYNHYVLSSTCTFQTEPESMESRREWFGMHGENYPVLVAEIDGNIVGWASLSRYHKRSAYRHTMEDSVYVRDGLHGKGIGGSLLFNLILEAKAAGHHSIIGVIAEGQPASVVLHEKMGFTEVAHLHEAGYKLNRWLDVKFYQLLL